MSERPIHLVSMAGYPNYGDELIAAAWLRFLAQRCPEREVRLDTRFPGSAETLFRGLHPRLRVTDAVFRTMAEAQRGERSATSIVQDLGSPLFDLQLLELREAETIHLLGGGFVNAMWPENLHLVEAMQAVVEISGARLIATGQGLVPDAGERFDRFDNISVRDEDSAAMLGIAAGFDDALLGLPLEDPAGAGALAAPSAEDVTVHLCIQSDAQAEGDFDRNLAWVRELLAAWGVPRRNVRYVEAIPGGDYGGYAALQDVIAEDGFVPFSAAWRDGLVMGPDQVWITTRFHHHMLAAAHGARGIALTGRSPYYGVKHELVRRMGSQWLLSDGELPVPALSELEAPRSFAALAQRKRQEAERLYS